MYRYLGVLLIATSTFAGALTPPSSAATIEVSEAETCMISLKGELVAGDFQKFLSISRFVFPEEILESTIDNRVCLDSPGGNLAEGVLFARHFYTEGVGTVVEDGAECYSACAIMFMMGTSTGLEVGTTNRTMHVGGTVGFHRPYLDLPGGTNVDSALMPLIYDGAFQAALDLISVANSRKPWSSDPMMKSDLMQMMLQHVGDDLYLIDTVDKAGRFDIRLDGDLTSLPLDKEGAFYACHNALQWQHGLTESPPLYRDGKSGPVDGTEAVQETVSSSGITYFAVRGDKEGYVLHRCVVAEVNGYIYACGVDQYTNIRVGEGLCEETDFEEKAAYIDRMALLDPSMPIALLRLMR